MTHQLLVYIEIYFMIGVIAMYTGSRAAEPTVKRKRWVKLITYFLIVHLFLLITIFGQPWFLIMMSIILGIGFLELIYTFIHAEPKNKTDRQIFRIMLTFLCFSTGMIFFSIRSNANLIIFVYMIVGVFDGFSQLTGQIFGRHPLTRISPNKTIEGSIGGLFIAILSGFLLQSFLDFSPARTFIFTIIICFGAMFGDLAASYVKRLYSLKDYNNVIPGHGGFLDRFDSFIAASVFFQLAIQLSNLSPF